MVSVNSNTYNISNTNMANVGNNQPSQAVQRPQDTTSADAFVSQVNKDNQKFQNGTLLSKNFGTAKGNIPVLLSAPVNIYLLSRMLSKKTNPSQIPKLYSTMIVGTTLAFFASYMINKQITSKKDEKFNNIKQKFSELNTNTCAKLNDKMFYSNTLTAGYMPATGNIIIEANRLAESSMRRNEKNLRHELVHAKQYETVARSKDGIRKLNFVVANTISKSYNSIGKAAFNILHDDVMKNKEYYKDKKINLYAGTYEVNMIDYLTAIHTMLNNKNAGMNDIPMIIDANHYQEVINKKGALTPDEEKKADEYYKAMLEYKTSTFFSGLNPWSSYHQNLLEKEAYEESPTFISKLAKRVGKKTE